MHQIAEIELVYNTSVKPSARVSVDGPGSAYQLFLTTWDAKRIELQEELKVMLLNADSKVLGICHLSSGGCNGTVSDPKLLFAAALKGNATFVILCHNHTSGNTAPSRADLELTKKVKQIGEILGLLVLDHLIITSESYFSFADAGLLDVW
ncbi:JAB domain-containing protein [Danxiaibacter flavus]|uniref:JAB domain-containing protein n=1 Tax=Danxiaibacter flavus TaxID=3049108 RepID=A0ABV3ZIH0_9BACT|nr:JAB domain-containing protein [Chitinophagaceae bacterium DXS]